MRIVGYNVQILGVSVIYRQVLTTAVSGFALLCTSMAMAGPVYQPQGANLTFGDVTHGKRVQSASSNPAAAAADYNRNAGKPFRGTVVSLAAGLEYGNVQELFEAIRHNDFRTDERLGVDLGALWVGENYQLGVQVTNVNEPKFTFPDVNLDLYRNPQSKLILLQDQQYEMDRQWKLEGSWFSKERRWSGHVGYDVDTATDPMGDDFQWATLSIGYARDSWWFPGARIGFRQNLAGTTLKYLGLGFTAFKYFNFDIASALDTVRIDGQKLPQGLMLSLGVEINS